MAGFHPSTEDRCGASSIPKTTATGQCHWALMLKARVPICAQSHAPTTTTATLGAPSYPNSALGGAAASRARRHQAGGARVRAHEYEGQR